MYELFSALKWSFFYCGFTDWGGERRQGRDLGVDWIFSSSSQDSRNPTPSTSPPAINPFDGYWLCVHLLLLTSTKTPTLSSFGRCPGQDLWKSWSFQAPSVCRSGVRLPLLGGWHSPQSAVTPRAPTAIPFEKERKWRNGKGQGKVHLKFAKFCKRKTSAERFVWKVRLAVKKSFYFDISF